MRGQRKVRVEELVERYKDRDVRRELEWESKYFKAGYTPGLEAEFMRWLCYAALQRIRELEDGSN